MGEKKSQREGLARFPNPQGDSVEVTAIYFQQTRVCGIKWGPCCECFCQFVIVLGLRLLSDFIIWAQGIYGH